VALIGVIASLATGTYDVTRTVAGTRDHGRYTPGATTVIPDVVACVQPVTSELDAMPSGYKAEELWVVYTTTRMTTWKPAEEGDTIEIEGDPCRIVKVEKWTGFGDTHYRAWAARQSAGA
jgi:hypothetical protein